ncbi:MAG: ATP-binding cassette domain-containing protein [Actinobacteria bacterium]|nr:MAG: ATP-binding cassette domain-containing protein [Actinomycetota bacterium]
MTTPRATGRRLLGSVPPEVRANPGVLAFVMLVGLLMIIPGLAVPLLVRVFLDNYLAAGSRHWAQPVVVGLVLAAFSIVVLQLLQYRVLSRLAVRLSAAGSARFVWHALRIPTQDVAAFGTGDLAARAAGLQVQAFQGGVLLPLAAVKIITVMFYSGALIVLDLRLGLVSVAVVVMSMLASAWLLRRRGAVQQAVDRTNVELAAGTTALVTAAESVKAAGLEQWVFGRWSQRQARAAGALSRMGADSQRLELVGPVTQTVGLGLVLAVGAWQVIAGHLTLGTLVASQGLVVAMLLPAGQLVYIGVVLAAVASIQRQADQVLARQLDPELAAEPADSSVAVSAGGPALQLCHISYGYDGTAAPVVDDISLSLPAGAWLAIVGGSGSGKTTIARLAIGELQPWSGQVRLQGVPRLAVPRPERTALIGYVPQYPQVMPGTLIENITMFDDTISLERVEQALADACVLEAVQSRPSGMYEPLTPTGHGFSGGELQRIAIARALVRDPELLVLDEATSALDPVVEMQIMQRLRQRGSTCLIVAHRLSTVRDADEVMVVEAGRVVQRGPFDVVSRDGRFAELIHG